MLEKLNIEPECLNLLPPKEIIVYQISIWLTISIPK